MRWQILLLLFSLSFGAISGCNDDSSAQNDNEPPTDGDQDAEIIDLDEDPDPSDGDSDEAGEFDNTEYGDPDDFIPDGDRDEEPVLEQDGDDSDPDLDLDEYVEIDTDVLEQEPEHDVEEITEDDIDIGETDSEEISDEDLEPEIEMEADEVEYPPLYPCGTNDRCPDDASICHEGLCVQCRSSDDCPQSLACIQSHCRRQCFSDQDCCSDEALDQGLCEEKKYCETSLNRCGNCRNDDDCLEEHVCIAGDCVSSICDYHRCLDYRTYIQCENDSWVDFGSCDELTVCNIWNWRICDVQVCRPFSYRCYGLTLEQCAPTGTGWNTITDCHNSYCNPEFGRCIER